MTYFCDWISGIVVLSKRNLQTASDWSFKLHLAALQTTFYIRAYQLYCCVLLQGSPKEVESNPCNFSYLIYDLTKNLIPYLRPTCNCYSCFWLNWEQIPFQGSVCQPWAPFLQSSHQFLPWFYPLCHLSPHPLQCDHSENIDNYIMVVLSVYIQRNMLRSRQQNSPNPSCFVPKTKVNNLEIKDHKLTSSCSLVGSGDRSGIFRPLGSSKGSSSITVWFILCWREDVYY